MSFYGVHVRKPTEDDLVGFTAGFGFHGTLSRCSPLFQVIGNGIGDPIVIVRHIGSGRIVSFKDARCLGAVPAGAAADASSCNRR